MGWAFVFDVLLMVAISLAGPLINPKSFAIDASMFKLNPSATALTVIIVLIITVLYVRVFVYYIPLTSS